MTSETNRWSCPKVNRIFYSPATATKGVWHFPSKTG